MKHPPPLSMSTNMIFNCIWLGRLDLLRSKLLIAILFACYHVYASLNMVWREEIYKPLDAWQIPPIVYSASQHHYGHCLTSNNYWLNLFRTDSTRSYFVKLILKIRNPLTLICWNDWCEINMEVNPHHHNCDIMLE